MSITEQQVNLSGISVFSGTVAQGVPASGWLQVPGGLTQVSAGSLTQVWGVNSAGNIYNFQNGGWVQIPGGLSCVSAAADGTVWGVNSQGNIYRRDGSNWTQIAGGLSQISVGSATQVWGVNSAGNIYQWNGSGWTQVSGGLSWVSAAADGTVWGVNSKGNIYRRDGSTWTQIPGGLSQISVGSATQVFGVNSAGNIYQWNGSGWTQVPGGLSNISVAQDGTLWGVNSSGNIYYYVQAAALIVSNPRLGEQDLDQGDTAAYLFDVTNVAPGTVLQNVKLSLLYDQGAFAGAGLTVAPNTVAAPDLAYGQTATVSTVQISASQTAQLGTYAFQGVQAQYQITQAPAPYAPVSSGTGGTMPFTVTPD
jgi:virginiamycin B lyase